MQDLLDKYEKTLTHFNHYIYIASRIISHTMFYQYVKQYLLDSQNVLAKCWKHLSPQLGWNPVLFAQLYTKGMQMTIIGLKF